MAGTSATALTAWTAPPPWVAYAVRRIVKLVLSVFVLITASFAIVHASPGDPVRNALGLKASPDLIAAKRQALGLEQPLLEQYADFLHNLVTGQFGESLINGLPISDMLTRLLPATAQLAVAAFVIAVGVAIPLGMAVGFATHAGRGRKIHIPFSAITGMFSAIPDFLLGVGLVFIFSVSLQALPVAGRDGLSSYVLPVLALATGPAAVLARIVQVETQRVLTEDYMRTARAKRLPARLLYLRHALPNLLTATLTVSGLILGGLLAGTVVVESVFAWPGLGQQLVQSILLKDIPVVQILALVFGGGVLLINLTVDVAIAIIDPRSTIREG